MATTQPRPAGGSGASPANTRGRMDGQRLGKMLVDSGLISDRQMQEALSIQAQFGGEFVDILFSLGYMAPAGLLNFLASHPMIDSAELSQFEIKPEYIAIVPADIARRYQVVPIDKKDRVLTLGAAAALDLHAVRALEAATSHAIKPLQCKAGDILAALEHYYPESAAPARDADASRGLEPSLRLSHVAHMVRQIKTLPALPETVAQVQEAMTNPEVPINTVVDIITLDPPIAAKVLSVANSAAYGFTHRITDLTLAVSLLGLREVYNIVLSAAVVDLLHKLKNFDYRLFWLESVCCATAARIVVRAHGKRQMPGAFSAGLLHDIGRAALWEVVPQLCSKLDPDLRGADLVRAEEEMIGLAHTEAGYELARHWNLPPEIAEPIRFHHAPMKATEAREQVAVVAVADAMIAARGVKLDENLKVLEGQEEALAFLGIDQENAEAMLDRYLARCEAASQEAFG